MKRNITTEINNNSAANLNTDAAPAVSTESAPKWDDLTQAAANIVLEVENDGEIYRRYTAPLQAQIAKRLESGAPVELYYLAQCSAVASMTLFGVKQCRRYGIAVSKDDRRAAALYLAACIIEEAKCEVE